MGKEVWHCPTAHSETATLESAGVAVAPRGLDSPEPAYVRDILCDCHTEPMYYFPVALKPGEDFVMCWVGECGRSYNRSLGYFHLRAGRPTGPRIQEKTRSRTLCPKADCSTYSLMAVTRSCYASTGETGTCWYCFACATEFACPFQGAQVLSFRQRLIRSLKLFSPRNPAVEHSFDGTRSTSHKALSKTVSL